jgi:hypothetical protein
MNQLTDLAIRIRLLASLVALAAGAVAAVIAITLLAGVLS